MQEFLESVLIDTQKKQFKLFSNFGDEKVVSCDTTDEFMNVLHHIKDNVEEECIFFKELVVAA